MKKRRNCFKTPVAVIILAAVLAAVFWGHMGGASAAAAQAPDVRRVVTVADLQMQGFNETDEFGRRTGLLIDYLNEIAKYTGWDFEFVETTTLEYLDDFLEGKFELLGAIFYSQEYEKYFAYPEYSMSSSKAVLFGRKDDRSMKGYELRTLNGKTIGVYEKATEKIRRLKEFLTLNGLDCTLKYYSAADFSEDEVLYEHLENGEVDLLLGNDMEAADQFRVVTSMEAQPYYIVTQPGNDEILDGLNMALEKILDSNPQFAEEHYTKNLGDQKAKEVQLDESDLAYIAAQKELTVAVVKKWHPFYCMDIDVDTHSGVIPDVLDEIAAYTGLKFKYAEADTYDEALALVRSGQADIMGAYIGTDEEAFAGGLATSGSYISLNSIIIKNKYVNFPEEGLTAGAVEGRLLPDSRQTAEIKYYTTMKKGLEAVNRGEVDYIYGISASLEREMQERRYANIVPVSHVNDSTQVSFAVSREAAVNLLPVLNKAIGSVTEQERSSLLDKNLVSIGFSAMSLTTFVYDNPVAVIVLVSVFLLLVVIIFLLTARAKMTDSMMRSELEKAEARNRAKSEFLSMMSHEIRTPMNAIVGLTDLACMEKDVSHKVEEYLNKIRISSQYLLSLINDILDMSRIENGKMTMEAESFSLRELLNGLENMMSAQAEIKQIRFLCEKQLRHDILVGDQVRLRQVMLNLLSNAVKFTPEHGSVELTVEETASDEMSAEYFFSVKDTGIGIDAEDQQKIFDSFVQVGENSARSAGTGLGLPIAGSLVRLMGGELALQSEPGRGSVFSFRLRFQLGEEKEEETEDQQEVRSLEGIRALIVEDNDLNAEIARELLEMQGMLTERAVNGKEALEMFEKSASGWYRIILMDLRMPVMDGLESTRRIRTCGHPDAGTVPIIAMTANSFKEDEIAAREAGMNGFISKPVDCSYLYRVMEEKLGMARKV